MAVKKTKRRVEIHEIEGLGTVAVRGLLFSRKEEILVRQEETGSRTGFMLDVLAETILDSESNAPAMTRDEWDEAAAEDLEPVRKAFDIAMRLSGMATSDDEAAAQKKDEPIPNENSSGF
jgi:hypothetical protein